MVLALVSIAGAVVLWPRAFPAATIDFRVTQPEAKARMAAFVEALGYPLKEYHGVVSFGEDQETTRYIELEYGIPRLEQVTREGLNVWYWSGRWFRPEQHEEFGAAMDPQGRMVGFSHTIEEEKALPFLDKEAARAVAEGFLRRCVPQHPLEGLRFVSDGTEEKPHRTDYRFTWERDAFRLGEAPYRLVVRVQGNEVGGYSEFLKVPERWTRDFNKKRETNNLCMSAAGAGLLAVGVGFVVCLVVAIRNHRLRWRDALPWGWFALFAGVEILAKVNGIPGVLAGYETTEKWLPFLGKNGFETLRDVLLSVGALWFLVLVADALYREKLPGLLPFRSGLGPKGFRDPRTVRSLGIGFVFALVSVAYVSAFYVVGRHWGVWAPVEIEDAKTLGGWLPWIAPVETGLSAAFLEEMLFRVIGLVVFWKVVRVRWLAVLLASATWAFLHSSYPQMPGYARGIELTVAGIVWSVLMLRYGVLTTLTAHYLYDCWLGEMVVFQSASWLDRAGAVAGAAWPVVLLGVSWWLCRRAGNAAPEGDGEGALSAPPPAPAEMVPARSFAPIAWSRWQRWAVCAAAVAVAVCCWGPLPQDAVRALGTLDLPRGEIAAVADRVVREHGFDPARYRRILTCGAENTPSAYLLEKGSFARLARLYRTELPDTYWSAHYFRVLEKEEIRILLDKRGRLLNWNHIVPREAPGASLPADEALALAKKTLAEQYGVDFSREKLVSRSPNRQERRLDYAFEFERTDWHWGDSRLRTCLRLNGDEPVGFSRYVKLPEAWILERQKSGWRKFFTGEVESWLNLAQAVLAVILFILLVARRMVPWRLGFLLALFPAAIAVAEFVLKLPWFFADYRTTMPLANYLAVHWLSTVLGIGAGYLGHVMLIAVALGFARWAFGWEWRHLVLWPRARRERAAFWASTGWSVLAASVLLAAVSRFDLLVNGFFLPAECGSFSFPQVNASVPWLRGVLSAADGGLSHLITLAMLWSVAGLFYRRFPRLTAVVLPLFPLLGAIRQDSWTGFFCALATGEVGLALLLFLPCRVFRFNAAAMGLTYTLCALFPRAIAFATHGGAGYRWQALPLALAVALPLAVGWAVHRLQPDADSGEAPKTPAPQPEYSSRPL
ncbi:MAG: type II CAAX endopeptidase family protein [Chthoniobacteraceae bacterium]|nr:type II CAAX endopeptidase family protein [Chthoniobacteraceae bacterium]